MPSYRTGRFGEGVITSLDCTITTQNGTQRTEQNAQSVQIDFDGSTYSFRPDNRGNLALYQKGGVPVWTQAEETNVEEGQATTVEGS